jgi:uncharacterized protein (TIGR03790 family)
VKDFLRCLYTTVALGFPGAQLFAGGSGLNVVVVVNQSSTNSVQLGNYYCERRGVPPQNLLRISWSGGEVEWSRSAFETTLRAPLNAMLAARQLTNQTDYVLLSMDIPYRVVENTGAPATSGVNSTTAALFYGFQPDGDGPFGYCNLPDTSSNSYAGSEGVFRQTPPLNVASNSWLVMMLTSSNLVQARQIVDRGVAGDTTFPAQYVYLAKTSDVDRNVRYWRFDNAVFDTRLCGNYLVRRTNSNAAFNLGSMLGYQTGIYNYSVSPANFVPGAMADNLTSFGGRLFESNGAQAYLWNVLLAGATASYGTVVEPCAYLEKFPSPQNYFYQARGFSIAECYYQSLTNPYQGILVGEPLSAPFAQPCSGDWINPPPGAVLSGTTSLTLNFNAASTIRPVQQVDLFVDGNWFQTLTNLSPTPNNNLHVVVNGSPFNYRVLGNVTIDSVVSGLVLLLNSTSYSNATKVAAIPHGDRIELRSLDPTKPGSDLSVSVSSAMGTAARLTTFINSGRTNFLDSSALGRRSFAVTNAAQDGSFLQLIVTKTNGSVVTLSVTNTPANTNTPELVQALVDAINTEAELTGPDGFSAEDFASYLVHLDPPVNGAEFNLYARSPGWAAAQLQVNLSGSAGFGITPGGTGQLDENLADLQPRNHLYVSAGLTDLSFTSSFDSATIPDGYHELAAVAYEGTHVRTQRRVSQSVRVQNSTLSATLTSLLGGTNTALEATLEFAVAANTNNVSRIEMFTTGGLFATSNNVSSAIFSVPAGFLGIGLHPFYALVTRADGRQYRTQTEWIRIIGAELPFAVSAFGSAPTLTWPATAGRTYQIFSTTNLRQSFIPREAVFQTNSTGLWSETNKSSVQRYYRVQTP